MKNYGAFTVSGNRAEIKKAVITKFLEEQPGTGKKELSSKYEYSVETLSNGSKILLKRPTRNKGFDFTVHAEGIQFALKGVKDRPSHNHIVEDLKIKQTSNVSEYEKVKRLINKIYNCENINDQEYLNISFSVGHPIETILKSIKWLFIEQDVTYWNWSGRAMLFSHLKDNDLC